jgi:hypothetical protein
VQEVKLKITNAADLPPPITCWLVGKPGQAYSAAPLIDNKMNASWMVTLIAIALDTYVHMYDDDR